jgi:hypothetical protein
MLILRFNKSVKMKKYFLGLIMIMPIVGLCQETRKFNQETLLYEGEEKHLSNVRQLTFGGDNAEAYFSFDSKKIAYQMRNKDKGMDCDQIYYFELKNTNTKDVAPSLISTGMGRTTCSTRR